MGCVRSSGYICCVKCFLVTLGAGTRCSEHLAGLTGRRYVSPGTSTRRDAMMYSSFSSHLRYQGYNYVTYAKYTRCTISITLGHSKKKKNGGTCISKRVHVSTCTLKGAILFKAVQCPSTAGLTAAYFQNLSSEQRHG